MKLPTYSLPDGWVWSTISEIALIESGQTPKDLKLGLSGEIPFFKIADMNKNENKPYLKNPSGYLSESQAHNLNVHIQQAGTIVFPKRGGAISTNKKRILSMPSAYDLNTMGILPLAIPYKFVYYWFEGINLNQLSNGSNVPQINHSDITPLPFPVAPLAEQHRIIAKIEELFSSLDTGMSQLHTVQAQLKRYRQAVLKAAFEGKLTKQWREVNKTQNESAKELKDKIIAERKQNLKKFNASSPTDEFTLPTLPDGWVWARVNWLSYVQTGPFGTQLHKHDYLSTGIPTIDVGNVRPDRNLLDEKTPLISKEKAIELKRYEVRENDVLFTRVGTVGRCTIVPKACDGWIMSSRLIRVQITSKYLLPKYLLYFFWSPMAQGFAKQVSKGTTRAGTNSIVVGGLPLIVPPLTEQKYIVEKIDALLSEVDNLKDNIGSLTAKGLRQSILSYAFKGKLVPQDPADESAEKLLERIKIERLTNKSKTNHVELSEYVK